MADTEEGGPEVLPVQEPEQPNPGLMVGDSILLLGGRLNTTRGKLYGFTTDRFSILPFGVSDRLIHVPLIDGIPDPEAFSEIKILRKATKPGFVKLIDFFPKDFVEAFGPNGEPAGLFQVISVNEDEDEVTLQVLQEDGTPTDGEEITIPFHFTGIPRDQGFEVLRTREPPANLTNMDTKEDQPKKTDINKLVVDDEDLAEAREGDSLTQDQDEEDFVIGEEVDLPMMQGEIQEVSSSDRIYPDVFQRSEMLSHLMRMLPQVQQRNPIKLQEVRRLVEVFMLMRNDVVQYGVTGEPRGLKPTTIQTLAELVKKPNVPMSRKVVQMNKTLYFNHTEDDKKAKLAGQPPVDPTGELDEVEGFNIDYQSDLFHRAEQITNAYMNEGGEEGLQETGYGLPKFHRYMEQYRKFVQQPLILEPGGKQVVEKDEEVFRLEVPNAEEKPLAVLKVPDTKFIYPPGNFVQKSHAVARLLKPRIARFLDGEPLRVVETGDAPVYSNVLLFPQQTLRDVGPIRSGFLANDIGLSMQKPTLMEDIIKELGPVEDYPTADGILNIGVNGILGNIRLEDWFNELKLPLNGMADVNRLLYGYGILNFECNISQAAVLQNKIEQHLAGLKIFMSKQREENASQLANLKFEPQSLLPPELANRLQERVRSEPILQELLERVKDELGDLAAIDTNWFSYVFLQNPDLMIAVLGQQPNLLTRERMRTIRDRFLQNLHNAYRIKLKRLQESFPDKINPCEHVQSLADCRRVAQAAGDEPGDVTKMKTLLKLLNTFRGEQKDDWVWCNVCKQHLICAHELLQIQEFIKPKEQEVIHKELLIKFSGGQFAGKFICRVCGQGIQNLDFDTNLEFDDEGRPMMGRAVMEDKDAIEEEELKELIGGDADIIEEVTFADEKQKTMYETIRTLTQLIGINPDESDYRKMVSMFSSFEKTIRSRNEYALLAKAAEAKKTRIPDYDIYYALQYTSAAAAILLLNIQCRVPDYIVYYTNAECRDGFYGYPLEEKSKITGLKCISTITAGINDKVFPWSNTTLQRESDLTKRRTILTKEIIDRIEDLIKDPILKNELQKKREYRLQLFGSVDDKKIDKIPSTFRPVPFQMTEEEAAEAVIVPDNASDKDKATSWIRSAHGIVRQASKVNPDSAFSAQTCCLHLIENPKGFWEDKKDLPPLPPRKGPEVPWRSGTAKPTFYTELPEVLSGKLEPSEYYKLFTKVCWQGPQKGLPHELGLTLTCTNCGLHFEQNPHLPLADAGANKEELSSAIGKLKAAMSAQGVEITDESYEDLLHEAQRRASITNDVPPIIPTSNMTFQSLANLSPIPMLGWPTLLQELSTNLEELERSNSMDEMKISEAAENFVRNIRKLEGNIEKRIGDKLMRVLQNIVQKSPRECGELVRTYLLVPFQRWRSGIHNEMFFIPSSYELSDETEAAILNRGLGDHLRPLVYGNDFASPLKGLLLRKVIFFIEQIRVLCTDVFPKLRSMTTPGGTQVVEYILRGCLMGPIDCLLDPQFIPEIPPYLATKINDELGSDTDQKSDSITTLYKAFGQALLKYSKGSSVPSEEEIRLILEQRAEAERDKFVKKLDRMTTDRRKVELVNKKLGLGDWAIGGSRAIREYNPERFIAEQEERQQAGWEDYKRVDMFGIEYAAENINDGYDHNQITEDDM